MEFKKEEKMKRRIDAKKAWEIANKVTEVLEQEHVKYQITGSLRRGVSAVHDIDIVVSCPANFVFEALSERGGLTVSKVANGKKSASIMVNGVQVDSWYAPLELWGAMTLFTTGSKTFNIMMRSHAKKQGLLLNQYGLFGGQLLIAGREELQIFEALGLKWVAPEDRNTESWTEKRLVPEM